MSDIVKQLRDLAASYSDRVPFDLHEALRAATDRIEALEKALGSITSPNTLAMSHARSCPATTPLSDSDCTCGLEWRIKLATEQSMHAAWRKRGEEAEAALTVAGETIARLEGERDATRCGLSPNGGSCACREGEPCRCPCHDVVDRGPRRVQVVTITIDGDACRSDFPIIESEYDADRHDEVLDNVRGACLLALGHWKHVADSIEFRVVRAVAAAMSVPPAGPERCPRCGAESPCTDWDSVDLGVGIQSFNYEWTCPTHGEFAYVSDDEGPVDFTAGRPAVRTSVRPVFRNDPEEPR